MYKTPSVLSYDSKRIIINIYWKLYLAMDSPIHTSRFFAFGKT